MHAGIGGGPLLTPDGETGRSLSRSELAHKYKEVMLGLEPREVWDHFAELCARPCEAGGEQIVRDYFEQYAQSRGFEYHPDGNGNAAVFVPGKGKSANSLPLVLQFHFDGVVQPEGHNFDLEPMKIVRETREIRGKSYDLLSTGGTTTLMADNRIGMAMALALAEDASIQDRPPLVLLGTWGEEVGLKGAAVLDPKLFFGAKYLINLDNEQEGIVFNRCAGQATFKTFIGAERGLLAADDVPILVQFSNLPGGHSGAEIHEARGNALKYLLQILNRIGDLGLAEVKLGSIRGGSARNAIPDTASALIWIHRKELAGALEFLNHPDLRNEFRGLIDAEVKEDVGELELSSRDLKKEGVSADHFLSPFSVETTKQLLLALNTVRHGIIEFAEPVELGRAELSNNFAQLGTNHKGLGLVTMARHFNSNLARDFLEAELKKLEAIRGISVRSVQDSESPGWFAGDKYKLLDAAIEAFSKVSGKPGSSSGIHAGVEPGVFAVLKPDMEQVSLGPNIFRAHNVKEAVEPRSVNVVYQQVAEMVGDPKLAS